MIGSLKYLLYHSHNASDLSSRIIVTGPGTIRAGLPESGPFAPPPVRRRVATLQSPVLVSDRAPAPIAVAPCGAARLPLYVPEPGAAAIAARLQIASLS